MWESGPTFHILLLGDVFVVCGDFVMDLRKEQRACIKVYANLRKSVTEILPMIVQLLGKNLESYTGVCFACSVQGQLDIC